MGRPLPGTELFEPQRLGLNSFFLSSAGLNVPFANCTVMEGTEITGSDVVINVGFCDPVGFAILACCAGSVSENIDRRIVIEAN